MSPASMAYNRTPARPPSLRAPQPRRVPCSRGPLRGAPAVTAALMTVTRTSMAAAIVVITRWNLSNTVGQVGACVGPLAESRDQCLECLGDTGDILGRLAENFEHSRSLGRAVVEGLGDLGGAGRDLGELPAPAVAHWVLPLQQPVPLECGDRGGDLVRDAVLLHRDGERGPGAELAWPGHRGVTDGP